MRQVGFQVRSLEVEQYIKTRGSQEASRFAQQGTAHQLAHYFSNCLSRPLATHEFIRPTYCKQRSPVSMVTSMIC